MYMYVVTCTLGCFFPIQKIQSVSVNHIVLVVWVHCICNSVCQYVQLSSTFNVGEGSQNVGEVHRTLVLKVLRTLVKFTERWY